MPRPPRPPLRWLPPLASGFLARKAESRFRYTPGRYRSSLANYTLGVDNLDIYGRSFALRGYFEWRICALAASLVGPGDVVIEGGAQVGTETLFYATLVGPSGRVVSFEADPRLAETVSAEVRLQGMSQVTVCAEALGPERSIGLFEFAADPSINSGLGSLAVPGAAADEVTTVPITTLDHAAAKYGDPQLVVMDIQGGELGALHGAASLLDRARPALLLEVEADSLARLGGSVQELWSLLGQHGYRAWRIGRLGLAPVASPDPDEYGDWLALPVERAGEERRLRRALVAAALLPPQTPTSPYRRARRV